MSNTTKTGIFLFSLLDYKAMETYFESMAEKGWMFERFTIFGAMFQKAEPQKLKFIVDISHSGNLYDLASDILEQDPIKIPDGMNLIETTSQFKVYFTKQEQPISFVKEDFIKERLLKKSLINSTFIFLMVMLIISIVAASLTFPKGFTANTISDVLFGIIFLLSAIGIGFYLFYYLLCFYKLKINIKKNKNYTYYNLKVAKLSGWFIACIIGLIPVSFICIYIDVLITGNLFLYFLLTILAQIMVYNLKFIPDDFYVKLSIVKIAIINIFIFTAFLLLLIAAYFPVEHNLKNLYKLYTK